MNLPMLLGLILSAVMVTGYSIKSTLSILQDHIANERNIQADAAAADPVNATEAKQNATQAANATKNIQADEVADEADDEDADKNACETYPENACVNGVAYGCKKEGMHAMYCWSSCTTIA